MKKRFTFFVLACIMACWSTKAQTDVTSLYLRNANFDSGFNYTTSDNGNVAQEILDVDGWTKDIAADFTITGVYEYGTAKTFNGAGVPATGYDGSSGGGLALSTGWEVQLKYHQEVTLPEGKYAIATAFYNSNTVTAGSSLVGWLSADGSKSMSSLKSFPSKKWVTDTVYFYVTDATKGKLQIGLQSVGSGSSNTAKVLLDFVKLLSFGIDKTELNDAITLAITWYGDGTGNGTAALNAAIEKAKAVNEKTNATMKEITKATEETHAAIWAYRLANANVEQPIDFTSHIKNPSFENNGFTDWINSAMQTQTNTSFTKKDGTTYAEKWVSAGNKVADASISQTITGLDNGIYILKATAQNFQQNNATAIQTGAYLFADDNTTEVNATNDYSLTFTSIEKEVTIGFKAQNATGNWIACDHFRLYYVGGSLSDIKEELQIRIDRANGLKPEKMQTSVLTELNSAVEAAQAQLSATSDAGIPPVATRLRKATGDAEISIKAYRDLQSTIDEALAAYGDGSMQGATEFDTAIQSAQTTVNNLEATLEDLEKAVVNLEKASFAFLLANASGTVPTVVTNPNFARGATMAFGRSTVTGVTASQLLEQGFCWSTSPEPTVLDHRTTKYFTNNGSIYRIEDLQPATVYYMRAYAITKSHAVGYGDVIKVITIPKGNITYTYNNGGPADANERISSALKSATDYWNKLTCIQGLRITCSYGSGTPTADCGYGGGMRVGPNASYQRTGTILHEMGHAIGVGTHSIWYGPSSPLRETGSRGNWLGERAAKVLQFWDNDPAATMRGDAVHMWPYGINGAQEDNGSELLYIGNSLITQALGEDGLPPTGGFATPAYTFGSEENVKYYIKNENEGYGLQTSYLVENKSGRLTWKAMSASAALSNDSTAWYLEFDPATCYYHIKNASTGKYFTYSSTGTNGIGLANKNIPTATENFQLMGARVNTTVGNGSNAFTSKGYWIVRPEKKLNPPCFAASANGTTMVTTFNIANSATAQRWLILTTEQVNAFEAGLDDLVLADLKVNGKTVPGFSSEIKDYTYSVAPDTDASSYTVTAEKAPRFNGTLAITQATAIPGQALVKATGTDQTVNTYTIDFVKNYVYRWDGNGATGTGSEPGTFGWGSTPSVTWGSANGTVNRYMDPGNGEYTGYTLDGKNYDQKRILWIRYNNSEEYTYAFNGLKAGNSYKLSLGYGWHNNGVAPNLTIGIYEKSTKGLIAQSAFTSNNTKRALKSGELVFTIPADMNSSNYYLSFKNNANNDCMVIIADLAVVDYVPTSLQETVKNDLDIKITALDRGLLISYHNAQPETVNFHIYSTSGQPIESVNVTSGEQKFVPLVAGIYIVNGQKILVK